MPKTSKPRAGSLQFWPRKRARKLLPSVNWKAITYSGESKILGFIGYKVGMTSALIKDLTPNSRTKDKRIVIPVTVIEIPPMKILSVRFYKNGIVKKEILNQNLDKELRKKIKLTKKKYDVVGEIDKVEDFDDVKIIVYSEVKKIGFKKTPDIIELSLVGSPEDKLNFIKENLNKEINLDAFNFDLIDVRGVTKGKGTQGPVKRFGIKLKQHKSEKGRRRPGNIGPWHPAHVTFRVPMAGQLGFFSRIIYNLKILEVGKIAEKDINPKSGWKNYGEIKTNYLILEGSVQGPAKRQLLITAPLRPTKKQLKKKYELIELR